MGLGEIYLKERCFTNDLALDYHSVYERMTTRVGKPFVNSKLLIETVFLLTTIVLAVITISLVVTTIVFP